MSDRDPIWKAMAQAINSVPVRSAASYVSGDFASAEMIDHVIASLARAGVPLVVKSGFSCIVCGVRLLEERQFCANCEPSWTPATPASALDVEPTPDFMPVVLSEADAALAPTTPAPALDALPRLWWCPAWGTLNEIRYHGNGEPDDPNCGKVAYVRDADLRAALAEPRPEEK